MTEKTTVEFDRQGRALIVRVTGPLEGYRETWQEEVDGETDRAAGDVILNLERASFINSRGMGFIFGLHKRLNAAGRRLLLVITGPVVRDAFEAAGVTELLRIYSSESIARDAL